MQFAEILLFYCLVKEGILRGAFFLAHDRIAYLGRLIVIVVVPFRVGMRQVLIGLAHSVDELKNVDRLETVLFHGVAHFHAASQEGDAGDIGGRDSWDTRHIAY